MDHVTAKNLMRLAGQCGSGPLSSGWLASSHHATIGSADAIRVS